MKKLVVFGLLLSSLCFAQDKKNEEFTFSVDVAGSDNTLKQYPLTKKQFAFTTPGDFTCTVSATMATGLENGTVFAKSITCTKNDLVFTTGVACLAGTGGPFEAQNLFVILDKDQKGAVIAIKCQNKEAQNVPEPKNPGEGEK